MEKESNQRSKDVDRTQNVPDTSELPQRSDVLSENIGKFVKTINILQMVKTFIETIVILTMWGVILNFSRRGFEILALTILTKMGIEFQKMRADINRMDDTILKVEFPELFFDPKPIEDDKDKSKHDK